jgi:transposase
LKFVGGVPIREIARRIGVAASTVRATIRRFQAAGLSWPLPEELTDAVLEAKLFADAGTKQGYRRQTEPRLGKHPSRAQAQARHAVDPLGRVR